MRFVVDESTGAAVVSYLRNAGHDGVAVAETMPQADDPDSLMRAATESRILITNDKDFGELIFRHSQPHSRVVLLRLQDESSVNRVYVVKALIEQYGNQLANHFTVATERDVRIRPFDGLA